MAWKGSMIERTPSVIKLKLVLSVYKDLQDDEMATQCPAHGEGRQAR